MPLLWLLGDDRLVVGLPFGLVTVELELALLLPPLPVRASAELAAWWRLKMNIMSNEQRKRPQIVTKADVIISIGDKGDATRSLMMAA